MVGVVMGWYDVMGFVGGVGCQGESGDCRVKDWWLVSKAGGWWLWGGLAWERWGGGRQVNNQWLVM